MTFERGLLVAGPNLTFDRTLEIDELRPGEVLRFSAARVTPGGKGVNVARVAGALGVEAVLVGFVPGRTGQAAAELLGAEGIEVEGVPIGGEIRNATVILERGGRTTVLNEPGPTLAPGDWEAYEQAVERLLSGRLLVCSGSLPPGAPAEAYARLVRLAGGHAVVDAAGAVLSAALEARPDVVTPNLAEAEGVLGRGSADGVQPPPDEARARALSAAGDLHALGPGVAVVTAGEAGVAVAADGEVTWRPAPRVGAVRNPVGAGDSFAGGLAVALAAGAALGDAVSQGLAAAAASVETALAGGVDPARVEALATDIRH